MNKTLKLLGITFAIACTIGIVISVIGWLLKWSSAAQFSNGFFWASAILIVFGVMSVMGENKMRANFGVLYSQSAGDMNTLERSKRWIADTMQGYNSFVFLLLTGFYLVVFSILITNIF